MSRSLLLALALLLVSASAASAWPYPGHVTGDIRAADPSIVIRQNTVNRYAIYTTHNLTRYSEDRIHLKPAQQTMPVQQWWRDVNGSGDTWAPDVTVQNGKYYMYYSVSNFGTNNSAIGLATSSSGAPGTWTDRGRVVTSRTGDAHNAIDAQLFVDSATGKWYLYFGSWFGGLWALPIDPATGKAYPGSVATLVARRPDSPALEAPFVYKRGGWFYMFMSYDRCCVGNDSDYDIRVARATSPMGPFRDPQGRDMVNGGGVAHKIYGNFDWVRGPGHPAVRWDSLDNHHIVVYGYRNTCCTGPEDRFFGINWLGWDANDWPYVH